MSLLKPGIQTPFHIDFEWWKQNESDWHVFLRSLLCPAHQQSLADVEEGEYRLDRSADGRGKISGRNPTCADESLCA